MNREIYIIANNCIHQRSQKSLLELFKHERRRGREMAKKIFTIASSAIASVLLILFCSIVSASETAAGHPILGLKSGESRLVGGVLYSYNVAPESRPVFVPGLPEKFQAGLAPSLKIMSSKKATAKERHRARTAISDTLVKYWTEPLPPAKQGDVKKAYRQAREAAAQVRVDLAEKRITYDVAINRLVEIAADLELSEARAFAGVAAAQKRRYRSWRGKAAPDKGKVHADLVAAYKAFFSGVYLKKNKEEKAQKKTMQILPRRPGELHPEIEAVERPMSLWHWYFCNRLPSLQFTGCSVETDPQPENTKWGYAVFLSEHPVTEDSLPPEVGPYHTSVLAGLYKLTTNSTIIKVTHTTYKTPPFSDPESSTRWYEHVVFSETFERWLIGNGSGSWVEENDTFHPFPQADGTMKPFAKVEYFDNEAIAEANAKTPWGSDPMIDACSYSVGDYALDWVCHQNANCFAWKMWGIRWLVNYPSNFLYDHGGGTGGADSFAAGNEGCAPRVDAGDGIHDEGGGPGYFEWVLDWSSIPPSLVPDGLFYQITEPYVRDENIAIIEQLAMTGEGFGLDSERCKFIEASVPETIVGPNYSWSTLREIPAP